MRSRILFLVSLAIILIAGLALRLYRFAPPGGRADPGQPLASLPPGFDSDEAFHTLAALRLTRGEAAPFFQIDQGLPAAMIYLIAFVFQFTGPVAEGGRLVSAIAGIVALIALPIFAWRLFPDQPVAVVGAAASTAFIYWFVNFSRLGLEQMTTAALISLAVIAFWQWQGRGRWKWGIGSGITLAVALYSYPAAYFLPITIAGYALYAITLSIPRWQPNWREAIVALAVFGIIIAPLFIFFIQNPDWATRRSTQVAGEWARFFPNYLRALGGLVWRGDDIVRHNLPGRPLLDPAQTILFGLGLLYCLRRWREAPFGFLLIWFGVMALPTALSAQPESFGRIAGAMGAIALIVGVGVIPLWGWLPRRLAVAIVAGGFIFSAVQTARDYFLLWPQSPAYLDVFDFPERLQAEAIASLPETTTAYLSPSDQARPMFAFLWGDAPRVQSFNGRVCTVFPEHVQRNTVWLVNALEDTRSGQVLPAIYPSLDSQVLFVENGSVVVVQYQVPAGATASTPTGSIGRVGNLVELAAAETGNASPGAALPVNLKWRVIGATADDWTIGLYLLDAASNVKAQDDRQPCDNSHRTSAWQPGEIIDEDRVLNLPPGLLPGNYTLAVAFYQLSNGQRLPTFAADGTQDTLLRIATITIP